MKHKHTKYREPSRIDTRDKSEDTYQTWTKVGALVTGHYRMYKYWFKYDQQTWISIQNDIVHRWNELKSTPAPKQISFYLLFVQPMEDIWKFRKKENKTNAISLFTVHPKKEKKLHFHCRRCVNVSFISLNHSFESCFVNKKCFILFTRN